MTSFPTQQSTVRMLSRCEVCGVECEWFGTRAGHGDGTVWRPRYGCDCVGLVYPEPRRAAKETA